jgi:hypothetical protein
MGVGVTGVVGLPGNMPGIAHGMNPNGFIGFICM